MREQRGEAPAGGPALRGVYHRAALRADPLAPCGLRTRPIQAMQCRPARADEESPGPGATDGAFA
jgi:hypothetical protein